MTTSRAMENLISLIKSRPIQRSQVAPPKDRLLGGIFAESITQMVALPITTKYYANKLRKRKKEKGEKKEEKKKKEKQKEKERVQHYAPKTDRYQCTCVEGHDLHDVFLSNDRQQLRVGSRHRYRPAQEQRTEVDPALHNLTLLAYTIL